MIPRAESPSVEPPTPSETPGLRSVRDVRHRGSVATERPARRSLGVAALAVACVALGVLYLARDIAIPFAFGLMLYLLLRPAVRLVRRVGMPKAFAAALVLTWLVGGLAAGGFLLSTPASAWAERLPIAAREVEFKSRALKAPVEQLSRLASKLESAAGVKEPDAALPRVALSAPGPLAALLHGAPRFLAQFMITLVTGFFLLLDGDVLLGRLFHFLPDLEERTRAGSIINAVERQMARYLGTVTLINVALGAALSAALYALGMPNPVLWGGMACLVNFVPYLGPAVGIGVVAIAAFVSFDTVGACVAPPLVYLAMTTIEGNLLTPLVLGRRFRVSPLVMFVWVVAWAWLWGIPGAVLAVPLLMLVTIVCEHSGRLAAIPQLMRG